MAVPTPDPAAFAVSTHEPPAGTQKKLYEVASPTASHVISSETLLPPVDPGATPKLVGAPGSVTHDVVSVTPLALHVDPQSFDALTQHVYVV